MKREELIAYDKWLTRRKWGTGEIISPEKAADLYLAEQPQPTAEGAEEILAKGKVLMFGHVIVDPIMLPEGIYALDVVKRYTAQKKRGYTVDEYNEIVERIRLGLVIALTSLTEGAFWEMTMEQLASKVSREQLQAVPNIGRISIEQFDRMMEWAGYKTKEET